MQRCANQTSDFTNKSNKNAKLATSNINWLPRRRHHFIGAHNSKWRSCQIQIKSNEMKSTATMRATITTQDATQKRWNICMIANKCASPLDTSQAQTTYIRYWSWWPTNAVNTPRWVGWMNSNSLAAHQTLHLRLSGFMHQSNNSNSWFSQ